MRSRRRRTKPEGLAVVPLAQGPDEALRAIPAASGVAQLLGPEGQNLLIGRGANLRHWVASHLGRGKPAPKGKRPPTDLSPIAVAVAWAATTSPFQQRLVYERVLGRYVPLAARRDLKTPAFLHLDPAERFPRLSVRRIEDGPRGLFGPFRDRRAAEKARDALQRLVPLRPCDYSFEPAPDLALGQGCLYAQVRTCAAPCLVRMSEADYRALAAQMADELKAPARRSPEMGLSPWVAAAAGRGLVLAEGREGVEVYPVLAGRVLDHASFVAPEGGWEGALDRGPWTLDPALPSDWPWLTAWLASPAGRQSWVSLEEPRDILGTARGAR